MKILFFIQDLGMGGVVRQISILSEHLARRGHDVSVLAMHAQEQKWKWLWNSSSIQPRLLFLRQPTGTLSVGLQLIKAPAQLRRLLKREDFQLLYSFSGSFARFISWLATRGIPNIKLIWGTQTSGDNADLYRRNWKSILISDYLCKWVSGSVPLMISNSEAGYSYRKAQNYRCHKYLVIFNGIDVEQFRRNTEAGLTIRSEWGVLQNEKLIGRIGRLDPVKGYSVFLEAAALLAKERKDVRFVIVGDGSNNYRRRLKLLSQKLGLTEHLIWAGSREDMPAIYNALDIICSSSYSEGFGLTVAEAMACGVPCVVTNVGDSAKIVGDEGIVVPPGDPNMLASGLRTMLLKLSDIKPYQIRDRIVKHFTIENMVDKTEKILIETYGNVK